MVKRRTGLDPLAYMGVEPSMPAQFVREGRVPTTTDYDGFNIGTVWIVRGTNQVFMLVDKALLIATWREFTAGVGAVNTLTGDVGGAVPPTANNIDIQGGDHFIFTGNPGASLLTLTSDGTVATSYLTDDANSAIPAAGVLTVAGGAGVATTSAGSTVTISAAGTVAVQIDTDVGGPVVPVAGVLEVFGGNNMTTTGAANRVTVDLTGTTDFAVQRGNAGGSLTSIPVGLDGQVIIGATGAAPLFASITSTGATITITEGANTINLETGATPVDVVTDVGTATVAAGILNVLGGDNIGTAGAGNTVTVSVNGTANFNPQMGNAAGSLDDIGTMTDGDLVIGSTGVAPAVAQLTAGMGIGIVNAAGSITISATGAAVGDVIVTTFNVSGTWTPNANTKVVYLVVTNAGGGGGGGSVCPSFQQVGNQFGYGGGGGAGGGGMTLWVQGTRTSGSHTVTVGAAGTGGAGGVSSGNGFNGTNAGFSAIGTSYPVTAGPFSTSFGGQGLVGLGGSTTIHGGGSPGAHYLNNTPLFSGGEGRGAGTGISDVPTHRGAIAAATGGGVGGTYAQVADFPIAGKNGGTLASYIDIIPYPVTGAAGGPIGVSGANGSNFLNNCLFESSGFGGGGGGAHQTNSGDGGEGGFPGGGGGGGGATRWPLMGQPDTFAGDGGDGSEGQVVVYEYTGI